MEVRHTFKVMTYDIDFAGVVSNQVSIRWLEDLRNLLTDQVLSIGDMMQRSIAPVLTRTEIDYRTPVRLPDTVDGRLWVEGAARHEGASLRDVTAPVLAQTVIKGILERTQIDPASIDEVILGCIAQPSEAPNIARVAALMAGIPKEVPAYTVARNCDSGMDAIVNAYKSIVIGDGDIYLVGGVGSRRNTHNLTK